MKIFAKINSTAGYSTSLNDHRSKYNNCLFLNRGKEVEIETEYLFLDQLNTAPIEGSELGIRLHFRDIESIRVEEGTFEDVQKQIKHFYKKGWEQDLIDVQFNLWRVKLGLLPTKQNYFK